MKGNAINYLEYDAKTKTHFIRLVGTSPKYTIQQRIDFMAAAEGMYEALKRVPQLYAEYCALRPDMSAPEREFVQSIIRQVDEALAKVK